MPNRPPRSSALPSEPQDPGRMASEGYLAAGAADGTAAGKGCRSRFGNGSFWEP